MAMPGRLLADAVGVSWLCTMRLTSQGSLSTVTTAGGALCVRTKKGEGKLQRRHALHPG